MTDSNDAANWAPNWGRLYTAMVTPMTESGGVDIEQAQHLAAALLKSGSDGVVVAGTTGESPTLTHEEERVLFRELAPVVHEAGGTLIAGTGSNSTDTAVDASEQAASWTSTACCRSCRTTTSRRRRVCTSTSRRWPTPCPRRRSCSTTCPVGPG